MNRRERERERHKREILDAALRVLAERGTGGLTVDEVAREAEFAVGSIYRHFKSKEELLEVLVVEILQPLVEDIARVTSETAPFEERLLRFVEAVLKLFREHQSVVQDFHAAPGPFPGPGTAAGDRLREGRLSYYEAVDGLVASGQRQGALPPGDPRPMSIALVGLVFGYLRGSVWGLTPEGIDISAFVVRAFLHGFAVSFPGPSPGGR